MRPLVSVIVCGYNQEAFLKEAVESVLRQTYTEIEVIAVDNGSTDNSAQILSLFKDHPRVKLQLFKENKPVTVRLNGALREAHGKFISLLYADDFYLPDKIEKQVRHFETLPPDFGVVYSPGYRLNMQTQKRHLETTLRRSGDILKEMFLEFHREGCINPISPLIRREVFEAFPFDEEVFVEGEIIFFRFATRFKFSFLDEPSVVMCEHDANVGKVIKKNIECIDTLIKKLERRPEFPEEARPYLRLYISRAFRNCGWQGVRVYEDPRWARQCFRRAISWRSSQAVHPRLLAGWALSCLPRPLLQGLNWVGYKLRHQKTIATFKEDYT